MLTLEEIYKHAKYIEIADKIQKYQEEIDKLMGELKERFPRTSKHRAWCIMGNNRPYQVTVINVDE